MAHEQCDENRQGETQRGKRIDKVEKNPPCSVTPLCWKRIDIVEEAPSLHYVTPLCSKRIDKVEKNPPCSVTPLCWKRIDIVEEARSAL